MDTSFELCSPYMPPPLPSSLPRLRKEHSNDKNRYLHFAGTTIALASAAAEPSLFLAALVAVVVGLNVFELTYMVREGGREHEGREGGDKHDRPLTAYYSIPLPLPFPLPGPLPAVQWRCRRGSNALHLPLPRVRPASLPPSAPPYHPVWLCVCLGWPFRDRGQ